VTAPSAAISSAPAAGTRPLSLRMQAMVAGLCYLLGAFAVTALLWRDPASRMVAGNASDADYMAWFFRYSAEAVAHLHLPALVTAAMNAPAGVNVMWNASVLLPGMLLAPVTLLAGPQVAATVMITVGFAGSALAMFVVLRRWGVSAPAAALAGFVYGFSPAVLHSAIGHYDLMFIVLPPLIADVVMRLAAGRVSVRRGGVEFGLLVTAQLFVDEEILFDTAVAVVILLLVFGLRRGLRVRLSELGALARGIGVGCAVVLVLAGYPLWIQFFGPLHQYGSPFTQDFYKNDLSGFIVPSSLELIHSAASAAEATRYQGNLPEYLGYLGGPLLIVLVGAAVWWWRHPVIRALAITWVLTAVFSLGGTLLVNGHEHPAVKLPWYWVQNLPVLASVLPDRFSLIADGVAAALLAFAIDAAIPAAARGRRPELAVLACAVLAVLPILPRPLPTSAVSPPPPGWSAVFADLRLPASATVLVVPVPTPTFTEPMRWQATSGEPSSLIGGYFIGPAWYGHAYVDGNGIPAPALYLDELWMAGGAPANLVPGSPISGPVNPVNLDQMRTQLTAWGVTAVVAVTTPDSTLARYLTALLGRPGVSAGDVIAWRMPAASS
jgi:hypothetical protein